MNEEMITASADVIPDSGKAENTPFRLKVKYNHEELLIPEEEAAVLAQKGLNYDKIAKNLEELKSDEGMALLGEMAAESGYSDRAEFLKTLRDAADGDRKDMLKSFFKANPDLKPSEIPDEVVSSYLDGKDIADAYERYSLSTQAESLREEIAVLKAKLEIKEEESANDSSAVGSASSACSTSAELYTGDQLDALSDDELESNLERALKSMSRLSKI